MAFRLPGWTASAVCSFAPRQLEPGTAGRRRVPICMSKQEGLQYGRLPDSAVHLCIDMQNLFSEGTPWHTPWMKRVLPKVESLARHRPERTVFSRFMPPQRPEDRQGTWRRYYERWGELTRERIDPQLLELVPSLAALAPPATVLDKPAYSPFHQTPLAEQLQRGGVDTLIVSGSETDVCVLAAVLDAVDLGLRVIVARDALCSSTDQTHDALMTLYHIRYGQQVEVADTAEIIGNWPH